MAVLQSTNVQGSLCVNGVAIGGGKDFKYCCFTASGNWTPTQDLVDGDGVVGITISGGGGGGGGIYLKFGCDRGGCICACRCGGAGGGGSVFDSFTDITVTTACCVVIGAGGTGGFISRSDADGQIDQYCATDGGNSSFGSAVEVTGGGAGGNSAQHSINGTPFGTIYGQNTNGGGMFGGGSGYLSGQTDAVRVTNFGYTGEGGTTGSVYSNVYRNECQANPGVVLGGGLKPIGMGGSNALVDNGLYDSGSSIYAFANCCSTNTLPILENVTSSNIDSSYYGAGASSSRICSRIYRYCVVSTVHGGDGNDGIAILKWME